MLIIIPARYDSTRLPGKPLCDIAGKSLLQRVYELARTAGAARTIIATDDERIASAASAFGAETCMTSSAHRSGTERIGEVVQGLGLDEDELVVNLQGDEPLMPKGLPAQVAATLQAHPEAVMATAMYPIEEETTLHDPNCVKVVCDERGYALYFSRAPLPWGARFEAGAPGARAYRHIGIYAYRAGFLRRYTTWTPCALEEIERLEQLRVLWY
ncbi:MAG TPA: 3-deoxy-manno-octulosonate cytidylyltransferase, partial [Gammaproteobacteria bacterium]|nr:3-deoxy-manno-octulosonate cytidylyltransferase [Gammaproteobacteria bacterium]